jgi:hypothetical protein
MCDELKPCPACGGLDDVGQLRCEVCGGSGQLGDPAAMPMSEREMLARRLVKAMNINGPDFDHTSEMVRCAAFRMADEVESFYSERLGAETQRALAAEAALSPSQG